MRLVVDSDRSPIIIFWEGNQISISDLRHISNFAGSLFSLSEMIFFELFGFWESDDGKYSEIFFELFGFQESNDGKYKINCEIKRKLKVCLYDLLEFWWLRKGKIGNSIGQ